ncbi:hypothetical protein BaRGS_00010439, partial [Batillaria attramentaria]
MRLAPVEALVMRHNTYHVGVRRLPQSRNVLLEEGMTKSSVQLRPGTVSGKALHQLPDQQSQYQVERTPRKITGHRRAPKVGRDNFISATTGGAGVTGVYFTLAGDRLSLKAKGGPPQDRGGVWSSASGRSALQELSTPLSSRWNACFPEA